MKLLRLTAKNYRSLRDESIEFDDFNVFIGANASGKSTILDALRFLHEGVHAHDFASPGVFTRRHPQSCLERRESASDRIGSDPAEW